jgi:hypothetical protein
MTHFCHKLKLPIAQGKEDSCTACKHGALNIFFPTSHAWCQVPDVFSWEVGIRAETKGISPVCRLLMSHYIEVCPYTLSRRPYHDETRIAIPKNNPSQPCEFGKTHILGRHAGNTRRNNLCSIPSDIRCGISFWDVLCTKEMP